MQYALIFSPLALFASFSLVEAQYNGYNGYFYSPPSPENYYFRSGMPQPSIELSEKNFDPQLGRVFFTVTVTLATSTSTTTATSYTTCTTSTSTLKTCTPSGRRRRGISMGSQSAHAGLYYNDEEENNDDGSIFLLSPKKAETPEPSPAQEPERVARQTTTTVPYVVQPGFKPPGEVGTGRFYFAFKTSTTLFTTTTTITSSLTATCFSTTSYQTCGSTGK